MSVGHETLEAFLARAKALRKSLKAEQVPTVGKTALRSEAKALGGEWHKDLAPKLKHSLTQETLEKYGAQFTRLIKLSGPNNRVASYLAALELVIKPFNDDLLIPSQQGALGGQGSSSFDAFFAGLSNADESDYLAEALACAKNGHLRAAVVLGWSAAIDRIQRVLEHGGLDKFNNMAQQMAAATNGRYKRFKKIDSVNSIAELQEVFDRPLLWVIEGMGMIDTNEHTRLGSCFDMRCHGAHPGNAPITLYNLMSFFSDLDQIIFMNPKFKLPSPAV
ncbi:hypothetical protein [Pelomonas sp. Root1237]|uniref:hypothetical protein n=1 Tax=Pelomonas sp. Root1237 TaxID=1736434 RepID=UPI0012F9EB8B|nr:hypothetical protein [Pelomonas sp. Root1237]